MLDLPEDPAPPIPGPLDWAAFQDMIRANNNVTWRNFNVVNDLPPANAAPSFAFKMAGAEDRPRLFAFEIERRLPEDAVLELEGPLGLLERLKGDNPWKLVPDKKRERTLLTLPSLPRIQLGEVRLPRMARLDCLFRIRPRRGKVVYGHGIAIRQLHRGEEVGRIVWRFAPEARLCTEKKEK
jgi:serine protease